MLYQPVARVLMTGVSTACYKRAIKKVLELTTNLHPEFEHGAHVRAWQVDFSLAQRDALASNLGKGASRVIRGCEVHYQRNVKKVCDKVNSDEPSKEVFKKIAYKIPYLHLQEDVELAFEILSAEKGLDEEDVITFLEEKVVFENIIHNIIQPSLHFKVKYLLKIGNETLKIIQIS